MVKINQTVYEGLRTGDLLLFDTRDTGWYGLIESTIKYLSHSSYSHIGMIIKADSLGYKKLDKNKIYVWESGFEGTPDPQDGKIKLGVQITQLDRIMNKYNGNLYIRKLDCDNLESQRIFNPTDLEKIHSQIYGKPYDLNIVDWLCAFCRTDYKPQKIDSFWCSAFVGYVYTKLKILSSDTDWSILRPADFSAEDNNKHLTFQTNVILENKQYLLATSL